MTVVFPGVERVFDTLAGTVPSLVIENQRCFVGLLEELYRMGEGMDGNIVVSENEKLAPVAKSVEVIDRFVPFELNRKKLLGKIGEALEKRAADETHFESTMDIKSKVENWLNELAFDFTCDLHFPQLSVATLIKSGGPQLCEEYDSLAEKILDYMELVREFDRDKLFITVNLRSYLSNEETGLLIDSVLRHGYHWLMIENCERERLTFESRTIIDKDWCEIS